MRDQEKIHKLDRWLARGAFIDPGLRTSYTMWCPKTDSFLDSLRQFLYEYDTSGFSTIVFKLPNQKNRFSERPLQTQPTPNVQTQFQRRSRVRKANLIQKNQFLSKKNEASSLWFIGNAYKARGSVGFSQTLAAQGGIFVFMNEYLTTQVCPGIQFHSSRGKRDRSDIHPFRKSRVYTGVERSSFFDSNKTVLCKNPSCPLYKKPLGRDQRAAVCIAVSVLYYLLFGKAPWWFAGIQDDQPLP